MSDARVFVSYRRGDSRHVAGRLADHLRWEPDIAEVFFDTDSIAPGQPFPRRLEAALQAATHTLVVIGPKWNGGTLPGRDQPRLFDPADFVRLEVATALAGSGTVIPVLVDGATMPPADAVPAELRPLLDRQAHVVHVEGRFTDEVRPLLTGILGHEPRGPDTVASIAVKAAVGAAAGVLAFLVCSAVLQFGLGLTAEDLLGAGREEASRQLWALVPYGFAGLGAVTWAVLRRRWSWPWLRRVQRVGT